VAFGLDILNYGGEAQNPYVTLPNGQPTVNTDFHSINTTGAYLIGFYKPLESLNLKAGFRYQYNDLPQHSLAPVFGVTYVPAPFLSFYGNYQTGFRYPTIRDLYLFPTANAELEQEKITSQEIGSTVQFLSKGNFSLSVFQNDARNLIQTVANPTPPPLFHFENIGTAKQWGVESKNPDFDPAKLVND